MLKRIVVSVFLVLVSISFVLGYGVFKLPDIQSQVGKQEIVQIVLSGDVQDHNVDLVIIANATSVQIDNQKVSEIIHLNLSAYEKKPIDITLMGTNPGSYKITYEVKDTSPGMLQNTVRNDFIFDVQGDGSSTAPTTVPSTGSGGGGGGGDGGGFIYTPYVAQNTNSNTTNSSVKTVPVVTTPVNPVQTQSVESDDGVNAMQATVPDLGNTQTVNLGGTVQTNTVTGKTINKQDVIILVLGMAVLIIQGLVLYIVKKEELL